nr:MAG TPA: hypothetical protein [Caudoviricetes sp.]
MDDKILRTKKEMKLIIKEKNLTRLEKYNLLRSKVCLLPEIERNILLKECKRDLDFCDDFQDVERLINVIISGVGLILALLGIILKDKIELIPVQDIISLLVEVGIFVIFIILFFAGVQLVKSKKRYILKHLIDVLEEN